MSLTISSYDAYGNQRTVGGDFFQINVGVTNTFVASDLGTGIYSGSYVVTTAGYYDLVVSVNNVLLVQPATYFNGAGFDLYLLAGDIVPSSSVIYGGGLTSSVAGDTSTFSIIGEDQYLNPKIMGGDKWATSIVGAYPNGTTVKFPASAADNGDGTYTFSYAITQAGYYDLTANYVPPAGSALAAALVAYKKNPSAYGYVTFTTPGNATSNATTTTRYVPIPSAAVYQGLFASGSGLQVSPSSISLLSYASGDGLGSAAALPDGGNVTRSFSIVLKDAYGNNVTQGDPVNVAVVVSWVNGTMINFTRTDAAATLVEVDWPGAAVAGNSTALALFWQQYPYYLSVSVSYTASYTITTAGNFSIAVTYLGRQLGGSPYSLVVQPAATGVAYNCKVYKCSYATGLGLTEGVVSPTSDKVVSISAITIYAVDMYGNRKLAGNELFNVVAIQPDGVPFSTTDFGSRAPVNDNGDGTYSAALQYSLVGVHTVNVYLSTPNVPPCTGNIAGCLLAGAGTTATVLSLASTDLKPADAGSSFMWGDAGIAGLAGAQNTFFVRARKASITSGGVDYTNRSCVTGGDAFNLVVSLAVAAGGNSTANGTAAAAATPALGPGQVSLRDNGDGTYNVTYNMTTTGTYNVYLTLGGLPLGYSQAALTAAGPAVQPAYPLTLTVYAAASVAATSYAVGLPTLSGAAPQAGVRYSFLIQACDRYGNKQSNRTWQLAPDTFELAISPYKSQSGGALSLSRANSDLLTQSVTVTDNSNGTFTASFIFRVAGSYNVNVYLGGVAVKGSPYLQPAAAGPISPVSSAVYGPGRSDLSSYLTNIARANNPLNIIVQAADAYGNTLTVGGSSSLIYMQWAQVENKVNGLTTIIDNSDGTYAASFTPSITGTYQLTLSINNIKVRTAFGCFHKILGEATFLVWPL